MANMMRQKRANVYKNDKNVFLRYRFPAYVLILIKKTMAQQVGTIKLKGKSGIYPFMNAITLIRQGLKVV